LTDKHTAEPWYHAKVVGWGLCETISSRPENSGCIGDCPIATCHDGAAHWEHKFPAKANAARIVECVNAHDTLRATVAELTAAAEDAYHALEAFRTGEGRSSIRSIAIDIHAAIAKAREVLNDTSKVECDDCEGTGRCYNNADPTCGQYCDCDTCKGTGEVDNA